MFSWTGIRDQAVREELAGLLEHDRRTAHLELSVCIDGGVAHIAGEVESEEERQRLRGLLRQQAGLLAVWDLIRLPGQGLRVADLGCGGRKQVPWAWGVDHKALPGVDVLADLERGLPFKDNVFDHIFAVHIIEHILDLVGLMNEAHRVLAPTGVLHVMAPFWRYVTAVADPTHVRMIDKQTFKYFCQPHPDVLPWRPLMVSTSEDTVFADLQPLKDGSAATESQIARWFH